eukprot:TRINITY_DN31433_c0_g1_i1.p1 TRINITY_DN31433_c0_g1~~TRINITY_DN31433_c0_g1_i1.p1  ORF type:complete len:353 (+),score=25.97 TRINITY_DN31433_c0_g1_i1:90-1148(+)
MKSVPIYGVVALLIFQSCEAALFRDQTHRSFWSVSQPNVDSNETGHFEPTVTQQSTAKVIFGLFTSPKPYYSKQLDAVLSTWAEDVASPHELLIVGVNRSRAQSNIHYFLAPECIDGSPGPGISCKEATLLSTAYLRGADWVVIGGTDNYVFVDQFVKRLSKENASVPQIFGIFGCGNNPPGKCCCKDHLTGLCGGGGYAISNAALRNMIGDQAQAAAGSYVKEAMRVSDTESMGWSDQVTSCIARRHGVREVQLDGLHGWRQDLDSMYPDLTEPDWRHPLTYHYVRPEEMTTIRSMYRDGPRNSKFLQAVPTLKRVHAREPQDYSALRSAYVRDVNARMLRQHPGVAQAWE